MVTLLCASSSFKDGKDGNHMEIKFCTLNVLHHILLWECLNLRSYDKMDSSKLLSSFIRIVLQLSKGCDDVNS